MADTDPRIFFAAERTLLAWIRTSIALVGLGFVVARFGLFLRVMRVQQVSDLGNHLPTQILGIVLSLLGALVAAIATWQHRRYYLTLGQADLPPKYVTGIGPILGFGITLAGIVLAIEMAW